MNQDPLFLWKRAALVATAVIVLSFPMARVHEVIQHRREARGQAKPATYVGRAKCVGCHTAVWEKYRGSDHDRAMDEATPATVLGDFNDATFTSHGRTSRFFRRDGKFFVNTQGPDGKPADFPVAYVFGVRPLQQYLIPFPKGRSQALSIAWDSVNNRWFDMNPKGDIAPGDWLHWTRQAQNWNSMCAECHSTNLRKNYDPSTDSYRTTWSEIDVSCEACHGPGSKHVAWAEVPAMGRAQEEDFGLVVTTRNMTAKQQVELCAPCHSRRYLLGPVNATDKDLLDGQVPEVLRQGLYHPDGQIQEEDYEYASFLQSKMYRMGVKCSDCHDVHSLKRHEEDNALCLQCHRATDYDTSGHHFHKQFDEGKPSPGWLCVKCHMPTQAYMVIDWRADHSIRIPRPDLSAVLGVPNACNNERGCHGDKPVAWSVRAIEKWYGQRKRPHYGTVFAAARRADPLARDSLIAAARDRLYSGMVRATAVSLLSNYPGAEAEQALNQALADEDSVVRLTAVRTLNSMNAAGREEKVAPLLYDLVTAVRIEAALNLSNSGRDKLNSAERKVYERNLDDYRAGMEYSSDFAFGRYDLGNLEAKLGQSSAAQKDYEAALAIDQEFFPAKVNLAFLYDATGRKPEAAKLFRGVLDKHPERYDVCYDLGLLLAGMQKLEESAVYLKRAAYGLRLQPRIFYNLGLVEQKLGRVQEAERALMQAVDLEPGNPDFLHAAADHYLKRGLLERARQIADLATKKAPQSAVARDIQRTLDRIGGGGR